jgi:hypothetical protein
MMQILGKTASACSTGPCQEHFSHYSKAQVTEKEVYIIKEKPSAFCSWQNSQKDSNCDVYMNP